MLMYRLRPLAGLSPYTAYQNGMRAPAASITFLSMSSCAILRVSDAYEAMNCSRAFSASAFDSGAVASADAGLLWV